ncbi:hypothetical protein ACFWZU_15625 [Frateuria sp. GZRR33]
MMLSIITQLACLVLGFVWMIAEPHGAQSAVWFAASMVIGALRVRKA